MKVAIRLCHKIVYEKGGFAPGLLFVRCERSHGKETTVRDIRVCVMSVTGGCGAIVHTPASQNGFIKAQIAVLKVPVRLGPCGRRALSS